MIQQQKGSPLKKWLFCTALMVGFGTVVMAQSRPMKATTQVKTVSVASLQGSKTEKKASTVATSLPGKKVTLVKVGNPAETAPKTLTYQVPVTDANAAPGTPKSQAIKGMRTVTRNTETMELKHPARVKP